MPTEMELVLEYTQQGASHEVSCGNKVYLKVVLCINPCDIARTSKSDYEGVKASANSVIIFFFTSAQDGNKLLDDERLSLADDLKKAHDQNQNKSK
ncbi:hypothetical protein Tco_0205059 [Tanacetum coccineum]